MRDFIYFMLQSSLLIGLVLLIGRFGKRFLSAQAGYCLWLIPMVRLCLPFFLVPVAVPDAWSAFHPYEIVWNAAEQAADAIGSAGREQAEGSAVWKEKSAADTGPEGMGQAAGNAGADGGAFAEAEKKAAEAAAGYEETGSRPESRNGLHDAGTDSAVSAAARTWRIRAALLWAAGCLITGGILLFRNIRFFRWIQRDAKRLTIPAAFDAAVRKRERSLPVYYKKELPSPCLAGLLRPALFVNERAVQDPEVLRMVLLHERMHYRQRDHIWNFCRNLLCVIYWFHPIVWWGSVASVHAAELSCDERVVEGMRSGERRRYGEALLALLDGNGEKRKLLDATTAMSGGKREMKERIFTIVKRRRTQKSALAVMLIVLLITGALGCTKAQDADAVKQEGTVKSQRADGLETEDAGKETAKPQDAGSGDRQDQAEGALADQSAEEEIQKYEALFSAATQTGADGIIPDYMDEEILIFHGYFGLVVYQFADGTPDFEPGVIDTMDFSMIGCGNTQGDSCAEVSVSEDGRNVYMHAMGAAEYYRYDRADRKLYRSRQTQDAADGRGKPCSLAEFLAEEALYELPGDIAAQETFGVKPEKKRYEFEMGTVVINRNLTGLTENVPVWTEKTGAYMKALKERFDRGEAGIVDEGWNGTGREVVPETVQDLGGAEGKWYKETEYVDENGNRIENPYDCPAWFRTVDGSKWLSVRSFDELLCSWGDLLFYRYDRAIYVTKDDVIAPFFTLSEEEGSIELFSSGKELGAYQRGENDVGTLTFYDAQFNVVKEYSNVRLEEFSESYYCLLDLDTGLYGYVDDSGGLAIPFIYSLAKGFHNGYASVLEGAQQEIYYEDRTVKMYNNVGGFWGIIDKRGNYVLEPDEKYSNSFDRDDLGEITAQYINGPVEFTQVGEDGYVEFVVRETGKVLATGYIVLRE